MTNGVVMAVQPHFPLEIIVSSYQLRLTQSGVNISRTGLRWWQENGLEICTLARGAEPTPVRVEGCIRGQEVEHIRALVVECTPGQAGELTPAQEGDSILARAAARTRGQVVDFTQDLGAGFTPVQVAASIPAQEAAYTLEPNRILIWALLRRGHC